MEENMSIKTLTDKNFQHEILENTRLCLVLFETDWCGCCQIMAPIIEKLAEEYEGKIKVGKLDFDQSIQISTEYTVVETPSILFFKNGLLIERFSGTVSNRVLENRLQSLLQNSR